MNDRGRWNRRVYLAALLFYCGSCPVWAGEEPPSSPVPAQDVPFSMPQVGLSNLPDVTDEESFLRSIRARSQELAAQAETGQDAMSRAELYLAAANLVLAHELEPQVSRVLLGLEVSNEASEKSREAQDALNRMETLLSKTEQLLSESKDAAEREAERNRAILSRAEQVRAFADAVRAFLNLDDSEDGRRRSRRAASRLAVLLEHSDPATATSAILWQALLRSRESDCGPAIAMLDHALADLPRQAQREAFHARLLRCKLVARQGGFAAAIALLIQMDERCEQWFNDPGDRSDAIRTAAWVQMQILRDWSDRLKDETQATTRKWCSDRLDTVATSSFSESGSTLLRLKKTAPISALVPEPAGNETGVPGGG